MDYLDLLTVIPTATGLLGLVLGLVVGSFLNVVIIRLHNISNTSCQISCHSILFWVLGFGSTPMLLANRSNPSLACSLTPLTVA